MHWVTPPGAKRAPLASTWMQSTTPNNAEAAPTAKVKQHDLLWPQPSTPPQSGCKLKPVFFIIFFVSPANDEQVSKCEIYKNTVCRCKKGYYKFPINSEDYQCRACKTCGQQEKVAEECKFSVRRYEKPRKNPQLVDIFDAVFVCRIVLDVFAQCSQVHRRKTLCVRAKTVSTEWRTSVNPARSESTHAHKHTKVPVLLCFVSS